MSRKPLFITYSLLLTVLAALLFIGLNISNSKVSPKPILESNLKGKLESKQPGNPSAADNIRVSDRGGSEVSMVVHPEGTILVGWIGGSRCYFAISTDGGNTWEDEWSLAPLNNGITGDPSVSIDLSGNFYAVCQDYSADEIRMSVSQDAGETWSDWESVQDAPDKPWVAGAGDGIVFLTWLGSNAGIKRSLDGGQTWGAVKSINPIYHGTAITTGNNGLIHIPYNSRNTSMMYLRSTDWGETWEDPRQLANMGSACFGCNPRSHPITGAGSDPTGEVVAITWAATLSGGDGDDDVWVIISRDAGVNWTDPIRVNDNTSRSRQFQPWTAVDKWGRVHVVWTDTRNNGSNAIYYANTFTDEFSSNVEITDERGGFRGFYGDYKGIAIDGNDVLFSWTDSREGSNYIYFSRGVGLAERPIGVPVMEKGVISDYATLSRSLYNIKGEKLGDVSKDDPLTPKRKAPGKYMVK